MKRNPKDKKDAKNQKTHPENTYDLVIIGAGLAGLTAAFEAIFSLNGTKKILILEKLPTIGGNSKKATSGINMLSTPIQEKEGVKDSETLFFEDTMKSGKDLNDPQLVSTLINDSSSLYTFLKEEVGIELPNLSTLGGHSVARTHRPNNSTIGAYLVEAFYKKLKDIPNIEIVCNATAFELLTDQENRKIVGLKYYLDENKDNLIFLNTNSIILSTGGFGADFYSDDSLLREFAKEKARFPTTNGAQTQGIGIKMARKLDIKLVDMDKIQLHPTGFIDPFNRYSKTKVLAPELFRAVGAILINQKGERFCNELGTRDYIVEKILKNCKKAKSSLIDQYESYLFLDQDALKNFGEKADFYIKKQYLSKFQNLYDFAEKYNLLDYYYSLVETIIAFKSSCKSKNDIFGRASFPPKFSIDGPFYAGIITPCIHYCMGGVCINKDGELIKNNGEILKGLFAAGEITGGVHGGNRLGGNSLMECIVFGRRVAKSAINYIKILEEQ